MPQYYTVEQGKNMNRKRGQKVIWLNNPNFDSLLWFFRLDLFKNNYLYAQQIFFVGHKQHLRSKTTLIIISFFVLVSSSLHPLCNLEDAEIMFSELFIKLIIKILENEIAVE